MNKTALSGTVGLVIFFLSFLLAGAVQAEDAISDPADPMKEKHFWSGWSGDIFAGLNKSNGNTDKTSASMSATALRKFERSQFRLKESLFYSESEKKMDGQKWDTSAKYSIDFGHEKRMFTFAQLTVDHDYFADIDYRVTPSVGLGYHIAKSDNWVWDADGGFGYRITYHRVNTAADDKSLTAIAHTFAKKRIFEKAYVSEDFTIYPGLEARSGLLVHSESAFINSLRSNLDLELKYVVDYNSRPAAATKKTDTQFIAGLKYKY